MAQLDSVEGVKGGAVMLTVTFPPTGLQLAFRRNHNDAQSVIDIFNLEGVAEYLPYIKEGMKGVVDDSGTAGRQRQRVFRSEKHRIRHQREPSQPHVLL